MIFLSFFHILNFYECNYDLHKFNYNLYANVTAHNHKTIIAVYRQITLDITRARMCVCVYACNEYYLHVTNLMINVFVLLVFKQISKEKNIIITENMLKTYLLQCRIYIVNNTLYLFVLLISHLIINRNHEFPPMMLLYIKYFYNNVLLITFHNR